MAQNIIVLGGSAGSLSIVREIVGSLPRDLDAAVFVVLHSLPRQKTHLPELLNLLHGLPAVPAEDGARIDAAQIYVSPPDQHLLLAQGHIHLSRGPKEGLNRPSINVTFRSAATTYRERVIGVLLSGMLDDGAAGLWEIANRGGITIVQDPIEAEYSSMPLNALRDAPVDFTLPSREIGPMLTRLVNGLVQPEVRGFSEINEDAVFSGLTCPECRGPLYRTRDAAPIEFRCRVGHTIPLGAMLDGSTTTQERKLYEAIVALQEGADLAEYAAVHLKDADVDSLRREAKQLRNQAETIRKIIEDRLVTKTD